jgi:cell division protein ZapA
VDENKFNIRIEIAERYYRMRINREEVEEELVRLAAGQVNAKYSHCRRKYGNKCDERDLLAMASFRLSEDNLVLKRKNDVEPVMDEIQRMLSELETYLENQ